MTQTMKAWFTVPGPEGAVFELRETPAPAPAPGQVLVAGRAHQYMLSDAQTGKIVLTLADSGR